MVYHLTFASTIPILGLLVNQQIIMKLTDIDLSSLADVAGALTLLESVHQRLATGGVPLPVITGAEPVSMAFVVNPAPIADDATRFGVAGSSFGFPTAALAADAKKMRGLGVDPITAQPIATVLQHGTQSVAFQSMDECRAALVENAESRRVDPMDAASIFGATAQSAAPLPLASSTAGVAPSPTAPAVPQASGALPALQALAPLPVASAVAPAAPAPQASPAGGVELDRDGLPWDARIHAGTKRRNADGRWTAKKGINDPDLVPRVVAQLRAQMAAGGVTSALPHVRGDDWLHPATLCQMRDAQMVAMTVPPVQAQSAAPLPASTPAPSTTPLAALPMTSGPASLAAPTPPALPVHQSPAAPQQSSGAPIPMTHQDFMTAATVEVLSGRLPASAFVEACAPYGGEAALRKNADPIPIIWTGLKAKYPGML